MTKSIRRSGFTLPEVLVTVTVVAVLAAVVVPAVTQYVSKGDAPSTVQDLDAIRGAVTAYIADTRKYPGNFYQLTVNDTAKNGWSGPYAQLNFGTATATGTFTSQGYGMVLGPTFTVANGYLSTSFTMPANTSCNDLWNIDRAVDNSSITNDASALTASTSGSVTWSPGCVTFANGASEASTTATTKSIRLIATGS
jgi:type IV pilus assembly protein PilE